MTQSLSHIELSPLFSIINFTQSNSNALKIAQTYGLQCMDNTNRRFSSLSAQIIKLSKLHPESNHPITPIR